MITLADKLRECVHSRLAPQPIECPADMICQTLIRMACGNGDVAAMRLIFDVVDRPIAPTTEKGKLAADCHREGAIIKPSPGCFCHPQDPDEAGDIRQSER